MKKNPLVSVIMPVYNGEKYLEEAIESILNQTFKDFELIIVDDGSVDKTLKIIEKYPKNNASIRLIKNNKNIGRVFSLNKALQEARGLYIARMDADDISLPKRIEKQINFLEKNQDYVIVGSNIEIINDEGKKLGVRIYPQDDENIRKTLLFKSPFAHPVVMFRKKEVVELGGYSNEYSTVEDYDLWIRILNKGKGYNLQEYLLKYRVHPNQEKNEKLKIQLNNTINLQKKYLFSKNCFSFFAIINWLALNILSFFPNFLILWLFKRLEFKKNTNYETK